MGVLLAWALPPTEASWDYVYIYRSTSESGTYTNIANQVVADNSYYDENGGTNNWYKIRYYNSSTGVYSGYSDAMSVSSVTVTYCSADDIARQLQVAEFGGEGATRPSLDDVENIILEMQDEIDSRTKHGWREKTATDEYHDLDQLNYEDGAGWPIYLKHRSIRTLDTSEGDKIEVWDGSSWTDWVASANYTEGRDEDYWVDYTTGVLYIKSTGGFFKIKAVRVTYRYGESSVPKDIRKCCILMTCIDILEMNNRTLLVPEEANPMLSYSSKIARWEKKSEEIMAENSEVLVPYGA